MSLSSDFFGGGGGGGFALGLAPVANSATFKDIGNTYIGNELGAIKDYSTDRGRLAPVSDSTYEALGMNIVSTSNFGFFRARLADRNSVWTKTEANFTNPNLYGIIYDNANNQIWLLVRNTGSGDCGLWKLNTITGVLTSVKTNVVGVLALTAKNVGGGRVLSGGNLAFYLSSNQRTYRIEMTSAGIFVSQSIAKSNAIDIKTSQLPPYVTSDEKILASEFSAIGGRNLVDTDNVPVFLRFVLTRGSSHKAVVLPFDGSMPLAIHNVVQNSSGNGLSLGNNSARSHVLPWGSDSVVAMANATTTTTDHREIYGKKVFDSTDFDRWLTEVADFYNMPTGEVFW